MMELSIDLETYSDIDIKQNGVYKGRKPIEHPRFNEIVSLWKCGTITATEAMKRLDMKPSTFYRKVKQL